MSGPNSDSHLVTIVIPTYDDDPEHLRDAIGSARGQEGVHVEVVVVDDGSTRAESLTQIETLGALTDVTVVRQDNAGPSAARNTGVQAGTGAFIICLDADDCLSPTFVQEVVQTLESSPDVSIAYPRMVPFGGAWPEWPTRGRLSIRDFAQRSAVPVSSGFRRTDWEAIGGWDEDMLTGMEDHEWWVRLLGSTGGVAAPIPHATLHYRIRAASRSRTRPYADDLAVTRRRILENNPAHVHSALLEGAWMATDAAEAEAARAWSDRWQLRRWGRALTRRARAATARASLSRAGRQARR